MDNDEIENLKNNNHLLEEINEEALLRATNPERVGVLSSGGRSDNFVTNIENLYFNIFKDKSFKVFFQTLDLPKTTNEFPRNDSKITTSGKKFNYKEQLRQTQLTSYNNIDDVEIKNQKKDTNEDYDNQAKGTKYSLEVNESKQNSGATSENHGIDKQLSLKDRAIKIFHELKKRLGLIRKSEDDRNIEPIEMDTATSKIPTKPLRENDDKPIIRKEQLEVSHDMKFEHPGLLESHDKIKLVINRNYLDEILKDKDIVFIITYLDDEIDVNNTFEILEVANELHIFPIVVTSLPGYFGKVENVHLMNKRLQKLRLKAEMVLLLPFFKSIDPKLVPDLILELIELIKEPGLINVDVADLKIIIKGGNIGVISFGSGKGQSRVKDAFFQTIDSKLLNVELAGVKKALLNVTGGSDMTIGEVEALADQIKNRIKPGARLILGARINQEWNEKIKIFLMLGVTPMEVMINRYAYE